MWRVNKANSGKCLLSFIVQSESATLHQRIIKVEKQMVFWCGEFQAIRELVFSLHEGFL